MALLPWDSSWTSRPLDPYFGIRLDDEDLLAPLTLAPWEKRLRRPFGFHNSHFPLHRDAGSTIKEDKDKFQVNVDVQHFMPEEIKVTSSGNTLTIEAKHEEKPDEHGYIARHFLRRYELPDDHDLSQMQSHLSSDGILSVTAPKIASDGNVARAIPIQHTGKPKRSIRFN